MSEEIKDVNKKIDAAEAAVKKYASKDTVISIGGYEFTPAKLMVAFTIVSSVLGGLYGAFEVHKSYQDMQKKIATYVAPDLSEFDKRLAVIEENSTKTTDYTRDIKNDIKNDIVREAFAYFNVPYTTCSLTSDIFSSGSGLASSSSYLISIIKGITVLKRISLTDIQICSIANQLEKKFNPLVGQQDFYGSGIGGLKKITFTKNNLPSFTYLDPSVFDDIDMFLLFTEKNRESVNILKTIDVTKSYEHLADVEQLEGYINSKNIEGVCSVIKRSWVTKKKTSPFICTGDLAEIDNLLYSDSNILCHKLCGAGGGGFFLAMTPKNIIPEIASSRLHIKISISPTGVATANINDNIS